jgi:hypothetical protein
MSEELKQLDKKTEVAAPETIIPIGEATAESVFYREFANLRKGLEEQKKLSWQIVFGVGIAFVIAIGLAVLEITLFHTRVDKDALDLQSQYFQEIKDVREKGFESELRLQKEMDAFKARFDNLDKPATKPSK